MALRYARAEATVTSQPTRHLFDSMDTLAMLQRIDPTSVPESGKLYAGAAALFAFGYVILQLQAHGIAALVAEVRRVRVVGAALVAEHIARMKRIGNDRVAAILTGGAQVVQAF
jgi:hypothetical protein